MNLLGPRTGCSRGWGDGGYPTTLQDYRAGWVGADSCPLGWPRERNRMPTLGNHNQYSVIGGDGLGTRAHGTGHRHSHKKGWVRTPKLKELEGCLPSAPPSSAHIPSPALLPSLSSDAQSCPTLCDPMNHITACQASLSITNSWTLPKLTSIESVMPSNHLILCHPLLLPLSIFLSIRVFSNESALLIRWPKYWSFSFNISPSNEHSGLMSFRMDWLDLRAVQGTLKSLLQHHSSSILWRSAL